jgi:Tfp pilus assembly protein PilV
MEVMVALAIMSVSLVAVFQLYSLALRSIKKADDYTNAVLYARSTMDEAYAIADPAEASGAKDIGEAFKVTKDVVLLSSSEDGKTKLYEITVTVSWSPSGNLKIKGLRCIIESKE